MPKKNDVDRFDEESISRKIRERILEIRNERVMLDSDLAELYGVPTKRLNEQVKRNSARFPEDFMFRLNDDDVKSLRSQIATSTPEHGGRRYRPYVFTEQGVAMLSGVLNSDRAVQVNIGIMRAFVEMRRMATAYNEIEQRLVKLEQEIGEHNEHFRKVFSAIRLLMAQPQSKTKRIGFIDEKDDSNDE
ncbi:MAG: ORF6N domain-containing protein [Aridibacter famidurans]|nr:ORF6N domain-containing protein [Aridibacter famidurans]